jgi:serine O-acetyltransferase
MKAINTFRHSLHCLIEDLDVYAFRRGIPRYLLFIIPLLYPTIFPIITYRFGYYVVHGIKNKIIRLPLYIIYFIFKRLFEVIFAIEISEHAHIGKGLFIAHTGGMVIGHGTIIGDHPSFHQFITIGGTGIETGSNFPHMGDNIYFGTGCCVLGGITLGDNVMIGANAVVTKSFPDNATLVGVPAKAISIDRGSIDSVHYRSK